MGSSPCGASISQWFSNRERGTRYGIWSMAHSMGEAFTFLTIPFIVTWFGWRWGFWSAGVFCAFVALILYRTLGDRPQTYGLPAVADYRQDYDGIVEDAGISVAEAQREALKNPYIWILGLSSIALYRPVRRQQLGRLCGGEIYTLVTAGSVLFLAKVMETLGAVSSGFLSDVGSLAPQCNTVIRRSVAGLLIFFLAPGADGSTAISLFGKYGL